MLEAIAQRQAHATENRFLRHGQHRTGVAVNPADEILHCLFELSLWHEAIDHAELQSALRGHGFTGQNKLKGDLGSDEERQNCRCERREDADADFRLGKSRFWRRNHEITEGRQLGATPDRWPIHYTHDRFADFQHSRERRVKRVEHLKDALRGVFTNIDSATEHFASGIENDQLDVIPLPGMRDSPGDFTAHSFIETILFPTIEGDLRDAALTANPSMLQSFAFSPSPFRRQILPLPTPTHFP